jgi:hypothetical protein
MGNNGGCRGRISNEAMQLSCWCVRQAARRQRVNLAAQWWPLVGENGTTNLAHLR